VAREDRGRSREAAELTHPVTGRGRSPFLTREKGENVPLLWIIVLVLIILAVGGGVAVSNLLWLLLVVALVVAVFAMMSGRRAL